MVDHVGNANNGNAVKKIAPSTTVLAGRTSGLAICQVTRSKLREVCGDSVDKVLAKIKVNDAEDWNNTNRRSNHDDRLGNLPDEPSANVVYREYHIDKSGLPNPGWARLVFDPTNRRMYFTPTHYDVWLCDREAAGKLSSGEIPTDTAGAQSPFFQLIQG